MVEAPLQVQKCGCRNVDSVGDNAKGIIRNRQKAGSRMFLEGSTINYGYLQDRVATLLYISSKTR